MLEPWVFFALLASLVWAAGSLIDKYVLVKWVRNPYVPVIVMVLMGFIAALAVFFIRGFSALSYLNILLAFAAGFLYVIVAILYFKAVKTEEISRIIPLFNLSPMFVLILAAVFLGEVFTPLKYLGIFLLIIGAALISSRNILKIRPGKTFWLIVLASFITAINLVIGKYLLGFADFWTIFSYTMIGEFIAIIPILALNFHDLAATAKEHGRKPIMTMSFNETLTVAARLLTLTAMSVGYVVLVEALESLHAFFVLLFAVILSVFWPKILKEEIGRGTVLLKLLAIILMFAGAFLVTG